MKQSSIVIKLVASSHKEVKSRHFAIKYATNFLFCYSGPMMQGFRVINALASSSLYKLAIKPYITGPLYKKLGHLWHTL